MEDTSGQVGSVPLSEVSIGDQGKDVQRTFNYLKRFGYFPNDALSQNFPTWVPAMDTVPTDSIHFGATLEEAVRKFQRAYSLPETGQVDGPTLDLMKRPRCGVPDYINNFGEFVTVGTKWPSSDITYSHTNFSPDLEEEEIRTSIAGALNRWAAIASLNFSEATIGDIRVGFFAGDHGDGSPFDGSGSDGRNVLAHCFYPPPNGGDIAGDCHFDEAETWSTNLPPTGIDLPTIALHEFGHGLGLDHSAVSSSVMYAFYGGTRRELTDDDIAGIRSLYGGRFPDWQQLDANPATKAIAAANNELYQLHSSGSIWRYTGTPMTGWQHLDANPATKAIAAANNELYQLHSSGSIWRYTA